MPAKNSIKEFVSDSYYHLYNRGVEKRAIFLDAQDYAVFLSYIKTYLVEKDVKALNAIITSPDERWDVKSSALKLLRLNNFAEEITIIAYCLMPNHFHFLIKQHSADSIDRFMNSLLTRYVMYFNRRYKRVGVLFQDVYKAVRITSDEQLLELSRYMHRNPLPLLQGDPLENYEYSSYPEYLGLRHSDWVKPEEVLGYFSLSKNGFSDYKIFTEQKIGNESNIVGDAGIDIMSA